jgi:DNA modification methylase
MYGGIQGGGGVMREVSFGEYGKLICGNALDVLRSMESDSVGAVITDPPYGIGLMLHHGRSGERIHLRYETIEGDWSMQVGQEVLDWCCDRGIATAAFSSPLKPWAGEWRSALVWNKGPAVGGGGDTSKAWKKTWEMILVARNGDLRCGRDSAVLDWFVTPGSKSHPCEKPIGLMQYLTRQITNPGDLVSDPFMGSGTTCVAAAMEGRRFIGVELEEKYFDIACKRVEHCLRPGMFAVVADEAEWRAER